MKRVLSAATLTAMMISGGAGPAFPEEAGADKAMPALREELAKTNIGFSSSMCASMPLDV